jgi:hypothetical protein
MKKLETLTPEQEASLATFRDKAINFALYGGDDLDVDKFHTGIDFVYSLAKINAPIKIYVDSPFGIQFAANMMKTLDLAKVPGDQVRDQVWDQVGDQVRDQVRDQVWDQVRDQVGAQVWDQVRDQVGAQVGAQVWDQVRDQVWDQVWAQVGAQVWDQVRDQVWVQVGDQVRDQVKEYLTPAYIGVGYDSGWLAFYRVFVEFNILKHDLFAKFDEFVNSGVWDTVMLQGVAIGCRRPCFVARDEENRLHNDNRSAIAWRDGFELFYLDGIALEKDVWQAITAHTMKFGEIMAIENADIRAVALKYNPDAMLNENAVLIDSSERGNELFLIENTDLNEFLEEPEIFMLRMQCPTGRVFVEGVEPSFARKHMNADVCQAHALGITPNQYRNLAVEG